MKKTEVYSWRVSSETKTEMENAARRGGTTVSALLDRITKEWIESQPGHINDDVEQQRLHAKVRKTLGTISGQDTRRAERAWVDVRKRLMRRYGR